jgi:hypothetical protein
MGRPVSGGMRYAPKLSTCSKAIAQIQTDDFRKALFGVWMLSEVANWMLSSPLCASQSELTNLGDHDSLVPP